jgi:uncharacterized UPF0160 family protein
MTDEPQPSVRITLSDIFHRVVAVEAQVQSLSNALPSHMAITKEKQDEYEQRLENHGTRLSTLDTRLTILETRQPVRAPWYSIVGGIVSIVTGVGGLFALIAVLNQLTILTK